MSVIFFPNTLILTNLFPKATMPGPPWSTKFTKTLSLGPLQSTGSKMITIKCFLQIKITCTFTEVSNIYYLSSFNEFWPNNKILIFWGAATGMFFYVLFML